MQAWKIDDKTDVMMMTVVINIVKITKNHVALKCKNASSYIPKIYKKCADPKRISK